MADLIEGLGGRTGFGENQLLPNDDGSSAIIDVSSVFASGLNFYGTVYDELFVNNNGSITFEGPLSEFTPFGITGSSIPIIAAYFADVDTRGDETGLAPTTGGTSEGTDTVFYNLDSDAGTFTVTWDDVGYYEANLDRRNAFQLILTDRSDIRDGDFDIEFRYEEIEWTTGDASGGTGGLGGTPARAGFSAGDGENFAELAASGTVTALLDLPMTPGFGTGENGVVRFEVRDGTVIEPVISLALPDALAVGEGGTATVSLTDGAPSLIAVTAERGLLSDPLSGARSEAVFLLTDSSGDAEEIRLDLRGTAGPRSTIDAEARLADPDAITDIAARVRAFLPAFVEDAVAARIEANVADRLGETVATLTASLAEGAGRLGSFGLETASATAALAQAIEAAGDFGSIEARGTTGSLGRGWASLADLRLDVDGPSVRLSGLADVDALRALSVDAAALYAVSNAVGRSVALSGDALALSAPPQGRFEQRPDGSFATASAFDGTLSRTADGYVVERPDGDRLVFDASGAFQRLEAPDGLDVVATLDGAGRIVALSGPNGAGLAFARRGDGLVTQIEDADGVAARLAYDGAGRLDAVTRPEGRSSFDYGTQGDLTEAIAPGGITAAFAYDDAGRLASASYGGGAQTEAVAYDGAGGVTITDGAGRETALDLLPGALAGRITDGAGNASEVFYDEDGRLAGVRAPDGTETGFAFDDRGRLTTITDANGATLAFGYDGSGEEPASFTDAGGGTRAFAYDAGGRITEATWPDGTALAFAYDSEGNLTGYANRRGDDVTYSYDARGRLLSESDGSVGATSYAYDDRGRLTSATSDRGTTTLAYDDADRVTAIEYPDGRNLAYTYDAAGLRSSITDGEGYAVFYDYDALGRLTGLRNDDGPLVAYAYDAGGNLVREENGNGTLTVYEYDEAGRLTLIENRAPDDTVTSRQAYGYDAAGQRVSLDTLDGDWAFGYDAVGQLTSAVFASETAEIADTTITYEYDAAGNRTRVVEDGVETLYEANALNQYTRVGDATFAYDADGNMVSRTDGEGTTTYAYDLDNRLVGVTQADGAVLAFEYDVFGNRVAKTVDGARTEYLVDPFGLGDVVGEFAGGARAASYAHGLGLAAAEIGGETAWYDADAVGSVTGLTDASGALVNRYAYTPFGEELLEVEGLANDFEFNGSLGVAEDSDDLTFMRARSYDPGLGRFLQEDPLGLGSGDPNFYRFGKNSPVDFADPTGNIVVSISFSLDAVLGFGTSKEFGIFVDTDQFLGIGFFRTEQYGVGIDGSVGVQLGVFENREAFEGSAIGLAGGFGPLEFGAVVGGVNNFGLKGGTVSLELPLIPINGLSSGRVVVGETITSPTAGDVFDSLFGDEREEPVPDFDPEAPAALPSPDREPNPDVPVSDDPAFGDPKDADPTRIGPADGDTRTYGDPHLITFDRTGYSFQAVGEFTLVLGAAFEVQARMQAVSDIASVNTAAAMRVGEDVAAVYAREAIPLVVNGTAVVLAKGESIAVGDLTIHRGTRGSDEDLTDGEYIVADDAGNGFYVRTFDGNANISPFVSDDAPVAGLLGNLDADRSNDFALRDGTVLDRPLSQTVLYGEYADSWRITQGDSLFLYREGEGTETFTDRDFPTDLLEIDDFDPAAVAQARATAEAAGLVPGTFAFETTVFDLLVTGNDAFAEALAETPDFGDPDAPDEPVVEAQINEAPELVPVTGAAVGADGTALIDVLAGATDPEGDAITLLGGTDPAGGVVSVEDGQLRFVPAEGFSGEAVLSFEVGDGEGGNVVTGTVRVEVPDDPDGLFTRDDAFEVGEDDGAAEIGDLLANDAGPDSATLTVEQATVVEGDALLALDLGEATALPGGGVLTVEADGTIVFDPAGDFERLGFNPQPEPPRAEVVVSYVVTDTTSTATAEAVIGVRGANDAPVAADDGGAGFSVGAGDTLVTASVLANDVDVDAGDALRVSGLDLAGTLGTVTDNGDGTFGYDPAGAFDDLAPGESATDTFVYEVADGQGATDTATVTITVEGGDGGPRRVTLGAPSEEVDYDGTGILVLQGFDVDEGGREGRADTVSFDFAGNAYALSTDQDIVDFTLLIETDGDGLTDAFVFEDDLVFVLGREGEEDGVARAIVLAGVVGRDGLTRERLEEARVDRAFQFPDEDDVIAGVVEAGDVPGV